MERMSTKFAIVKGYIQMAYKQVDGNGKTVEEEKGGFVEDWVNGQLWVYLDVENHKVLDANFDIKKLIENIEKKGK